MIVESAQKFLFSAKRGNGTYLAIVQDVGAVKVENIEAFSDVGNSLIYVFLGSVLD